MEIKEEYSCSFIPTTLLYSISTEDVKKEELDLEDPQNAEELIKQNIVETESGFIVQTPSLEM